MFTRLGFDGYRTVDVEGSDAFAVSLGLRERDWQVPAYTMPKGREDLAVLRIVCRGGLTTDLADWLIRALTGAVTTPTREARSEHPISGPKGFHH